MREDRPSLTARWIAAQRARLAGTRSSTPGGDTEGERRLYQTMGRGFVLPGLAPTGLAERTRFIDEEVARAIGRGVEQIVLIGAGYDGRALRFGGGPTRWIEVDFPSTQADKHRRLSALGISPSGVTYAGVDLMTGDLESALTEAGHDPARPSLFVCEGLLASLSLEVGAALCETLRARSAPASVLAVNFRVIPAAGARGRALRRLVDGVLSLIGETRRTEFLPGDPEKLMVVTGWHIIRSTRSAPGKVDQGAHLLVVACEPSLV
ncbi:MAG TPA: SAM-dependent methyltransferase [Acidimicrobiales bacterium]|nr:SAM-dependent methyltransferase [Acidimicrobiales bacterium]